MERELKSKTTKGKMGLKKENSLKWGMSLKDKKSDESILGLNGNPLDLSYYKSTKKDWTLGRTSLKEERGENIEIISGNTTKSSTWEDKIEKINPHKIEQADKLDTSNLNKDNFDNATLYDSLISRKTISPSNATVYYSVCSNSFIDNKMMLKKKSLTTAIGEEYVENVEEEIETEVLECCSEFEGLKTCENPFVLRERPFSNEDLSCGEWIYDNCIRIIRFLSQGAQAKIYIGMIEEIEKEVAVKRYVIDYNEEEINRIVDECEIVKNLEHPNVIKYFDVEITNVKEGNVEGNSTIEMSNNLNGESGTCPNFVMSKIDIIMEYIEGMNLKEYLLKNTGGSGLSMESVKIIAIKILEGLEYLHSNKIIHRDLKPENVLVNEDLGEIKIVDFGISTKVKDSETFRKRTALGTPYYMAPEVISEKPYAYECDIWSLGCIVYELVGGVKPYADMTAYNAMYNMVQYTSPLEYADDNIKDIFYDRSNRNLLDFLQKCWRPNNSFRPSASELLQHKFLTT